MNQLWYEMDGVLPMLRLIPKVEFKGGLYVCLPDHSKLKSYFIKADFFTLTDNEKSHSRERHTTVGIIRAVGKASPDLVLHRTGLRSHLWCDFKVYV